MMPNNMFNMMNKLSSLMQNPSASIMQMGLGIPNNIANDPNAIMQYLTSSGRFSQSQINQANQMAQQMRNSPWFSNIR